MLQILQKVSISCGALLALSLPAFAADEEVKSKFNLRDVVRAVVQEQKGPLSDSGLSEDVLKKMQKFKVDEDRLKSLAFDQVEPVRRPIFISTDPAAPLATIFVTKTRPTTIAFLDSEGKPVPVNSIGNVTAEEAELQRFSNETVDQSEHIYKFSTKVTTGWTTMDLHIENVPYPVPVIIEAGHKYHAGAQAIVVNDTAENMTDSFGFEKDTKETDEPKERPATLSRVLATLANYGARPSGARGETDFYKNMDQDLIIGADSAKKIELEYMSMDQFRRPKLQAYKAKILGDEYFLVRTNGQLLKPAFLASVPAASIGNKIWAYAIPSHDVSNILTVQYGGGNHVYAIKRIYPIYSSASNY